MLYSLHVKDLALIEEQDINFGEGLNILTGETGAGKSILIGSINLCLGEKADKTLIRAGAEYALIEMTFGVTEERVLKELAEMDIAPEADGTLIIQRKLYRNRSVCRVNGETTTLGTLRMIASSLLSIHGQNEHQTLLIRRHHLDILDASGGAALLSKKEEVAGKVRALHALEKELLSFGSDERTRQREADLARYEIAEIEEASPKEGEEEALEETYRRMRGREQALSAVGKAKDLTEGQGDYDGGVLNGIAQSLKELTTIRDADEDVLQMTALLTDAECILRDAAHAMNAYLSDDSFDEETFVRSEERLNVLHKLSDKYGSGEGIQGVLRYLDETKERLSVLSDYDTHLAALKGRLAAAREDALHSAKELSAERLKQAEKLAADMTKTLTELNFKEVQFEIPVHADEEKLTIDGIDETGFLISLNKGEAPMPLEKIASGGELSRIMLALKTLEADDGTADACVFDEVDAGISGKTAFQVALKLSALARERQVICITHLPQIASMADTHFFIEKEEKDGRTVTGIRELTEEESVRELARLSGTGELTERAVENAREMKKKATEVKTND